jgi:glycosyl hydrolase family 77 (putative 4-alpha-glucanotransferase)
MRMTASWSGSNDQTILPNTSLPTILAPPGSSGATRSITGRLFAVAATAGVSIVCVHSYITWTPCAWTISAVSPPPGTCRPAQRRRNLANGCPAPGAEFFEVVQKELGGLPFIAEDLGIITPDVSALRDRFHLPGTRVLQFAFDGHPDNPHLPENYTANTVVYTGTHDNPPTREWYEELPASQRQFLCRYLKRPEPRSSDAASALMELAWSSPAALAIVPLQDVLSLGPEARMNVPGRAEGNWRWRCPENMLSVTEVEWLRNLTKRSSHPGVLWSLQTAH